MSLESWLLQMLMVAADPRRVNRERLRDAFVREYHPMRGERPYVGAVSLAEYCARFNGWYLKLSHHVHNTELL